MEDTTLNLNPPTKTLWCAYLIAPAVAPLLFAIAFFVSGVTWLQPPADSTGTPIGIILIPILALTVGMVVSYFVAAALGMPVAFHLRKRQALNFYTIHGAAFVWTLILVGGLATLLYLFGSPQPRVSELIISALVGVGILSPFILLSATTFWWMIKRDIRRISLKLLFVVTMLIAILAAVSAYFVSA